MSEITALAIVCIRNEAIHIRRCLSRFIEDGIDVFLIDNDSTDGSEAIAREFLGHGLIGIEHLTWRGSFSLSDQLRHKSRIAAASHHDWIIHADADEWLCSPVAGQTLLEGIAEAAAGGFNAINFHEIVFVPLPGQDFYAEDYASRMADYYFFQPSYPRLNRAWRKASGLDSAKSGGHELVGGDLRLAPTDFFLRHYIALSEPHARDKYLGRRFSNQDLEKGWHNNRREITADRLRVKRSPGLKHMTDPNRQDFDLSAPLTTHFWDWPSLE